MQLKLKNLERMPRRASFGAIGDGDVFSGDIGIYSGPFMKFPGQLIVQLHPPFHTWSGDGIIVDHYVPLDATVEYKEEM